MTHPGAWPAARFASVIEVKTALGYGGRLAPSLDQGGQQALYHPFARKGDSDGKDLSDNRADACLREETVMGAPMRFLERAAVCLAVLTLASAGIRAQAAKPQIADLAGTWVLDQKTTSAEEKPPDNEGRGGRSGLPGGFGGGFSGGGGMGFGPSGPPDRAKIERQRRITQAELAPPRQIVITAADAQLVVTADDERPETLVPDGKKHLRLTGDGEINTTTTWGDGLLVTERHYDEGIKATRTYHVGPAEGGGRQLVVTLKLEGGHMPKKMPELMRVYLLQ